MTCLPLMSRPSWLTDTIGSFQNLHLEERRLGARNKDIMECLQRTLQTDLITFAAARCMGVAPRLQRSKDRPFTNSSNREAAILLCLPVRPVIGESSHHRSGSCAWTDAVHSDAMPGILLGSPMRQLNTSFTCRGSGRSTPKTEMFLQLPRFKPMISSMQK